MLHKNCAARDPHAQCSLGFGDAYLILSLAGRRFAGSSAIRARTPGTNPRGHGLRTVGDSLFSRGVATAVVEFPCADFRGLAAPRIIVRSTCFVKECGKRQSGHCLTRSARKRRRATAARGSLFPGGKLRNEN